LGGELSPQQFPLPNAWSGTSPLLPIILFAIDGINTNYSGPAGMYKGVRAVNVKNFNAKDEVSLGPDTWVIYPARAKEGLLPASASGSFDNGYAVLKVV
jgi:hypothetical protein